MRKKINYVYIIALTCLFVVLGVLMTKYMGKAVLPENENIYSLVKIEDKYEYISSEVEDERIVVRQDNKYGYIDTDAEIIVPCIYDAAETFEDGVARVTEGNNCGYIDIDGMEIVPVEYDHVTKFHDDLTRAYKDDKWVCYDKTGRQLISEPLDYNALRDGKFTLYSEGLLAVSSENKWGFVNEAGIVVIPLEYDMVNDFSEKYAIVKKDQKYGAIDMQGNIVIPIQYEYMSDFKDGFAVVKINGKYGCIGKNAKMVVSAVYDSMGSISEEMVYFETQRNGNKICGYIDKYGKIFNSANIDGGREFSNGYAAVSKNGKWGMLNRQGKIVIPCVYEKIGDFSEGLVVFCDNNKYGYMNDKGEIVIENEYNYAWPSNDNLLMVLKGTIEDGEVGVFDIDGKEYIPCEIDNIPDINNNKLVANFEDEWYILTLE